MKEADIQFGERYAVDTYDGSNEPVCLVVHRKLPPKTGASRSRMYQCRMPDDTPIGSNPSGSHYDASKIRMLWSEYEKTPEYKERHLRQVKGALDQQVWKAVKEWSDVLTGHVKAATGDGYVSSLTPDPDEGIPELLDRAMKRCIQTDVGTILNLAGIPLPDTEPIQSAMDQRDEVLSDLLREVTPARDARLNAELDEWLGNGAVYTSNDIQRWIAAGHIDEYVAGIILAEIKGPHPLLVRLAKSCPHSQQLKDLTENPLFTYLIPHLDFGVD